MTGSFEMIVTQVSGAGRDVHTNRNSKKISERRGGGHLMMRTRHINAIFLSVIKKLKNNTNY